MDQTDGNQLTVPISNRDHIQGVLAAPIAIVSYGDYQCLYCGEVHKMIQHLQQQFGNQLCFVFRHFPRTQFHPQAYKAAEIAEAAAAQGKFWLMHDRLFAQQQRLENGYLLEYANELSLDISRLLQDLWHHSYVNRIADDIQSGTQSGVTTTPALFINNVRYRNAWNLEQLRLAIVQAMPK
ncbi:DsbA family protein [Phormidesmis sp. 146-35]